MSYWNDIFAIICLVMILNNFIGLPKSVPFSRVIDPDFRLHKIQSYICITVINDFVSLGYDIFFYSTWNFWNITIVIKLPITHFYLEKNCPSKTCKFCKFMKSKTWYFHYLQYLYNHKSLILFTLCVPAKKKEANYIGNNTNW